MKNVIQKHNSKIMEDPKPTNNKTCSCRQKSDCPLNESKKALNWFIFVNCILAIWIGKPNSLSH